MTPSKKKFSVSFPLHLSLIAISYPMKNVTESEPVMTHLCQSKGLSPRDQRGGGQMTA